MKGFTLIEALIILAIVGILLAIFLGPVTSKNSSVSFGYSGIAESRCINGYKFVTVEKGVTQILDKNGHGIPCN